MTTQYQIGDAVRWSSNGGGTCFKVGTVVAIVPAGRDARKYLPAETNPSALHGKAVEPLGDRYLLCGPTPKKGLAYFAFTTERFHKRAELLQRAS
jgi:hypothetical protein